MNVDHLEACTFAYTAHVKSVTLPGLPFWEIGQFITEMLWDILIEPLSFSKVQVVAWSR